MTSATPSPQSPARRHWPGALVVFGLIVFCVGYGRAVLQAETALRDGEPLLLELAPRDPRAFLTGDHMIIDLALARGLAQADRAAGTGMDAWVVTRTDAHGVEQFVRSASTRPTPAAGERVVKGRHRGGRWRIGTDAYYFAEGEASRFEQARYGDYRLTPAGEVLLTGLRDAARKPLAPVAPATSASPVTR